MRILKLEKNNQKELLKEALLVLQKGGTVVYPTDTSYGLGCDASNPKAIKKVYALKDRALKKKPVHVLAPSIKWAKGVVTWNKTAEKLAKKFLPGPLSIALPLKISSQPLKLISPDGYLGLRLPANDFAIQLVKLLKSPITATSANPAASSGGFDPYSAEDVIKQFEKRKQQPDLIIDAGKLKRNKPSTFVLIEDESIKILRNGPISERSIYNSLK